jgi:hypothetical protein
LPARTRYPPPSGGHGTSSPRSKPIASCRHLLPTKARGEPRTRRLPPGVSSGPSWNPSDVKRREDNVIKD